MSGIDIAFTFILVRLFLRDEKCSHRSQYTQKNKAIKDMTLINSAYAPTVKIKKAFFCLKCFHWHIKANKE